MSNIESGVIKGMIIFGEDLPMETLKTIREKCDLLVVQDVVMTEAAKVADVVLPMTLPVEEEGTYTSTERKVQRLKSNVRQSVEMRNWEVIQHLMNTYSVNSSYTKVSEITEDIIKENLGSVGVRSLLEGADSYYWTNGTSRILFEGAVTKGVEFKVIPATKPGFDTHINTDIIRKLFSKEL